MAAHAFTGGPFIFKSYTGDEKLLRLRMCGTSFLFASISEKMFSSSICFKITIVCDA
jgi:hypothetical protein